ncbi:hypothetical protein BLOT_008274, partial [Blomia tropicalis]
MIDLNIQTIAKWFEKGCCTTSTANTSGATNMMMTNGDTSNGTYVNDMESSQSNTNEGNDQFYILQCNDICLLSKLTGVKNQTLFDRARKQMDQIMEPVAKKNFLLTICSELLRDGRRSVLLKMIDYEVEHNTELFKLFPTDLLFHRALCLLKHGQPTKALADLYMAFEHGHPINGLDRIHVQILEEIKKYLSNRKTVKDGFITNANNEQITFEQILIHYENEIVYFQSPPNERPINQFELTYFKLIIEYDNSDSPRMAISCLSNVTLPGISKQSESLHFRFYKSENQKHLRICKQNQIKTSRECYFWRTTGCQNYNCKYFHNKLAKGVDYQEWMKIEQSGTANVD